MTDAKVMTWVCNGCNEAGDGVPCKLELTDGVKPHFCPLDRTVQKWKLEVKE